MSAATMSGSDGVKSPSTGPVGGSKQQLKNSTGAKTLDSARKQTASPVDGQKAKQQQPAQKAWQGTNPSITQRSSTQTPNGTEKPQAKAPVQAPMKNLADTHADKHAHDRALFALANFIGLDVTIILNNGEQFTGICSGGMFDHASKPNFVLKMVKRIKPPTTQQVNGNMESPSEYIGEGEDHMMVFDHQDVALVEVNNVDMAGAQPLQNGSIASFRTDTEISGRDPSMPRERELQRWDAGADSSIDMSLESSGDAGWDQFATNERMYGVQSTYDENIYTTAIDRSNPLYRQREAEAARIAREIEGSAASNAHVAEERRVDADGADGLDEEAKYSGVQRESITLPKRTAGAYIPPSQRPITNAPTVRGAPFDPAIISLAKPVPSTATERAIEPVSGAESVVTPEEPQHAGTSEDPTSGANASSGTPKKPFETTTEDHVRNVTDAFKQFANNEKLRARQQAEAKKSNARAEKNVRLNDLKKFAANFKLKSRVPDDLVPILAKDREKQIEIQHKADEAAKEEEIKVKDREKEKMTGSPTPSASSQVGATTVVDQRASFSQQQTPRSRASQSIRALPIQQSPGRNPGQGAMAGNRPYPRPFPAPQPLPTDMRIPTGPAMPAGAGPSAGPSAGPMSPKGMNPDAKAFEFRPGANAFTPAGPTPSPQRTQGSSMERPTTSEAGVFFDKEKRTTRKTIAPIFHPVKREPSAKEYSEEQKKTFRTTNGGMPQPYRTPPTWVVPGSDSNSSNINVSYRDVWVKPRAPSTGPSPMNTPNPGVASAHLHQLPSHLQGPPHMHTRSHGPQFMPPPPQPGAPPQGFDPRMQQFGPNGSVQNSPRFAPAQIPPFNGQMQGMPMPQFGGQQMPGYGMSPSMGYRQVNMPPPNGPMMMMPNQQHAQMAPMPQGYPRGPGPQFNPQMMGPGGVPMMNQQSAGGFMNGPMPGQGPSYSPMPPPSQPHMPHMQNSPRPHMMQHTGSHQGFQPHMMHQPQFAPSPVAHPPHPYHMQQRQMSAGAVGYGPPPHSTPRQHQAVPHASPGMGGVPSQGDEGK